MADEFNQQGFRRAESSEGFLTSPCITLREGAGGYVHATGRFFNNKVSDTVYKYASGHFTYHPQRYCISGPPIYLPPRKSPFSAISVISAISWAESSTSPPAQFSRVRAAFLKDAICMIALIRVRRGELTRNQGEGLRVGPTPRPTRCRAERG
jgi:hypothetical protein